MSFRHLGITARIEGLSPVAKLALYQFSDTACETCGMCWPGVPYLMLKTGMKETTTRAAITALEKSGHIVPRDYRTGGRGMATEYVVLPGLVELSTAPCGECVERMKRYRKARGMTKAQRQKVSQGEGYDAKGIAGEAERYRVATPIQSDTDNSVSARAREAAEAATSPPISEPTTPAPPRNAKEALARVNDMLHGVRVRIGTQSPAWGKDGSQAKTDEGRGAAEMPPPDEGGTMVESKSNPD